MNGFKQLALGERDQIALMLAKGFSQREIAKSLGRSNSTISDEIKRNGRIDGYEAALAGQICKQRKALALKRIKIPLKNQKTYAYVLQHIRMGWSPEQISGRIKRDFPSNLNMRISHETIYKFIYSVEGKKLKLWEYVPRKQKRRKHKNGRKVHRSRIADRVSIHDRPEIIENREEFGHWEGDSVIGKGRSHGLHTEVERTSRLLEAVKVDSISSADCINAQLVIFKKHPQKARKTTTLDNGRENHKHGGLKELKMQAYFADPYSSWQRGTNEYHNGLLRRYFPKGTDFTKVPDEELNDVVLEINSRPRRCLDFKTPIEVYNDFVKCSV